MILNQLLLKNHNSAISNSDLKRIAVNLDKYSSSDITQLAKDAAMAPLREMSSEQVQR